MSVGLIPLWTLSVAKSFVGRKLTYGVKWGAPAWEAGAAALCMLSLGFIAASCLSAQALQRLFNKASLSAKRLLGLHNHGAVAFPFSERGRGERRDFSLSLSTFFEIVSLHVK